MAKALVIGCFFVLVFCGNLRAEQEYTLKAGFLLNFSKYVEWPSDLKESFGVCVLGENPFGSKLNTMAAKMIKGKKTVVKTISAVDDSFDCDVLFVSASEGYRLNSIIDALRERPVLTVSDIPGFERNGGIIGLFIKNSRIRFNINMNSAARAHLKISSYLLELAESDQGK